MRRKSLFFLIFNLFLALSLVAGPAALAHHKDGHEGGPKDKKEKKEKSAGDEATSRKKDKKEKKDNEGNAYGHDKSKGNQGKGKSEGAGKKNDGTDDKGKDGDEPYTDGAPGNNGTIKVDGEPYDTSKGMEPHVGCEFRVLYWGFDEGDDLQSTLTFTAHAPTSGDFSFTDTITLGDGEPDVAGPYNLVDELIAAGIAPHPKQGWHIKLTTNTEYSQGADVKHKVFWIQCDEAPVAPTAEEDVEGGTDVQGGGLKENARPGTEVLGGTLTAGSDDEPAERGTQVAGAEASDGSVGVLPFTGMQLMTLLAIAAALLATGAVFLRMRRSDN